MTTPCCYTGHGVEAFALIERILWAASVMAEIVLAAHFYKERLVRRYPFFIAYITSEIFAGVVLFPLGVHAKGYAQLFRLLVFVTAVLRIGVAAELYERICEHFPGIGRFRFALASVLITLGGVAALGILSPQTAARWVFPQTATEIGQNYQGEILAALFVLTWCFFRYVITLHQPFRHNVLTHWRLATFYFAVGGLQALAVLLTGGGAAVHPINSAMLAADIVCFSAWIRSMRSSGEELPAFERLSPAEIEAVERQHQDLMDTVKSLPREVSARLTEN